MGLAASQARLLFITGRKNDIEFNQMQLSNEKISLSRDSAELSDQYNTSLNQRKLTWSCSGNATSANSVDLTYNLLMGYNTTNQAGQYLITDTNNRVVLSSAICSKLGSAFSGDGGQSINMTRADFIAAMTSTDTKPVSATDINSGTYSDVVADAREASSTGNITNATAESNITTALSTLSSNRNSVTTTSDGTFQAYTEGTAKVKAMTTALTSIMTNSVAVLRNLTGITNITPTNGMLNTASFNGDGISSIDAGKTVEVTSGDNSKNGVYSPGDGTTNTSGTSPVGLGTDTHKYVTVALNDGSGAKVLVDFNTSDKSACVTIVGKDGKGTCITNSKGPASKEEGGNANPYVAGNAKNNPYHDGDGVTGTDVEWNADENKLVITSSNVQAGTTISFPNAISGNNNTSTAYTVSGGWRTPNSNEIEDGNGNAINDAVALYNKASLALQLLTVASCPTSNENGNNDDLKYRKASTAAFNMLVADSDSGSNTIAAQFGSNDGNAPTETLNLLDGKDNVGYYSVDSSSALKAAMTGTLSSSYATSTLDSTHSLYTTNNNSVDVNKDENNHYYSEDSNSGKGYDVTIANTKDSCGIKLDNDTTTLGGVISDAASVLAGDTVATASTSSDKQTEVDYYTEMFYAIQDKGWTKNANVTNQSYLQNQMMNGSLVIEQLKEPGTFSDLASSDPSSPLQNVRDTDGVAIEESKYTAAKDELDSKESVLDINIKNLDTERSELDTEIDSVKGVITKNIERSFKMFA